MTAREAADVIAEKVYEWTKETGLPLILTQEDREEIARLILLTKKETR